VPKSRGQNQGDRGMGANKKSKWGMAEALKILKSLDISEREKLLETMGKSDPEMASVLQSNLLDLEDLIYLTPKMLVEFMREIKIQDLGLSLRMASSELKGHF
jgi:flagellar motor switch protein FliG